MLYGRLEAYLAYSKVSSSPPLPPSLWHFRVTNWSDGLEGHYRLQMWLQVLVLVRMQVQVQVQAQVQVQVQV